MIPTALSRGTIIDCRELTVTAEFSEMTEAQINLLALSYYEQIMAMFAKECYINWIFENKRVKNIHTSLLTHKKRNGCFDIELHGDVRSQLVYDEKSFTNNKRTLLYGLLTDSNYAEDYEAYYEQNIRDCSKEELKGKILNLFSETGRYYKGYYNSSDLYGFFSVTCERETGLFYGQFVFRVSAYSLQSEVVKISEEFAEYLKRISLDFDNINARIALAPALRAISNWHCYYFCGLPLDVEATSENMRRWRGAMYTYIHGAEWFNIVSPKTVFELPAPTYPYDNKQLLIETLNNGALLVKCIVDIIHADATEIRNAKAYLYNYLLPGRREFSLAVVKTNIIFAPRHMWEICPMFDDEIEISNDKLVFKNISRFDPDRLKLDNW